MIIIALWTVKFWPQQNNIIDMSAQIHIYCRLTLSPPGRSPSILSPSCWPETWDWERGQKIDELSWNLITARYDPISSSVHAWTLKTMTTGFPRDWNTGGGREEKKKKERKNTSGPNGLKNWIGISGWWKTRMMESWSVREINSILGCFWPSMHLWGIDHCWVALVFAAETD